MEQRDPAVHDSVVNMRGRGEMIMTPIDLQDLRRRAYAKVKAEPFWRLQRQASAGSGGVNGGCPSPAESYSGTMSHITLGTKCAGKRSAGNPHAAFEAAGTGNGATVYPMRARRGKPRTQPRAVLRATAPVLDPTGIEQRSEVGDGEVHCTERLGGLLKCYRRAA